MAVVMYHFCLILSCIVLVVTTRGSCGGTLGGALSHTNTEVRLDLPLLMLGPHPLLVAVGSEPLGDLFALPVSPSGRSPSLFGEGEGRSASVARETEGSA